MGQLDNHLPGRQTVHLHSTPISHEAHGTKLLTTIMPNTNRSPNMMIDTSKSSNRACVSESTVRQCATAVQTTFTLAHESKPRWPSPPASDWSPNLWMHLGRVSTYFWKTLYCIFSRHRSKAPLTMYLHDFPDSQQQQTQRAITSNKKSISSIKSICTSQLMSDRLKGNATHLGKKMAEWQPD